MKIRFLFFLILFYFFCIQNIFAAEVDIKKKIGQMLVFGFEGDTLKEDNPILHAIHSQTIGGVILFDYDFKTQTFNHNIQSPEQLKALNAKLQNVAKRAANKNRNYLYPLWVSIDYEGGERATRLQERHGFPKTLSAAQLGKLKKTDAFSYAQKMSDTLKMIGVNLNLAPVLDVNVNPDNPAIGKIERSFSENPNTVVKYARIFSNAYHQNGIFCAYKHFPGHGSSTGDTHEGFVDVSKTWNSLELEPYEHLLNKPNACQMVMVAHVTHKGLDPKGLPASLSADIIDKLLRKKLKFDGVVISDDMQMKAIINHYGLREALRLAINAGNDILVFANQLVPVPQNPSEIVDMIYQDIQDGYIKKSRIESAYNRIMKLKNKMRANR